MLGDLSAPAQAGVHLCISVSRAGEDCAQTRVQAKANHSTCRNFSRWAPAFAGEHVRPQLMPDHAQTLEWLVILAIFFN